MNVNAFLTVKEIADLADLDTSQVRRLLGQGRISKDAIKAGGAWFVPRADVDAWLSRRTKRRRAKD